MSLIFKGHPDYKISTELKKYQINCGNFYAKCTKYDVPFGYHPTEHNKKWRSISANDKVLYKWNEQNEIKVYDQQDNLILSKSTFYTPCFNLYGNGFNLEDTFFTIIEDGENNLQKFNIYDLSGKLMKSFNLSWYSLNFDIYITLFNNITYAIIYANDKLSVTNLDKLEYIGCDFYKDDDESYLIPLLGQNKMYVIEILNNNVIFNTGHVCLIDNINYETSKWLLLGNPLYDENLYNNKMSDYDNKKLKHFIHTHGIFSAEYDYEDHCGRFDSNIGKFARGTMVTFKENGNVIFEMNSGSSPSIILYGNGKTREGTKFCIGNVSIYDFNQKLIRRTCIGSDSHHDIQRVNDKYAISTSIEVCTWSQFSGLIDLELFFNQTGDEEQMKPYDNARTYIPMCNDDVLYATCADEDGFILNNGLKLRYEDAEDFDFSNGTGYATIDFSKLGYNDEQVKKIYDIILHGGVVSIPISNSDKKIES